MTVKRRRFFGHQSWSAEEITTLQAIYSYASSDELKAAFPSKNKNSIKGKAQVLGLRRPRQISKHTPEQIRNRKTKWANEDRKRHPDKYKERSKNNYIKNRTKRAKQAKEWNIKHFFKNRSYRLVGITAQQLARLWIKQRGLCALTGRKLDRSAEIDHKIARSLGGSDQIENLQWLCCQANQSKWDFTEAEFIKLCRDVVEYNKKFP